MKILIIIPIIIFLLVFFRRRGKAFKKNSEKTLEYYSYNSKINSWNPYLKVCYSLILIILCVSTSNIYLPISVVFIGMFLSVGLGKVPLNKYIDMLKIPMIFLIISIITINMNFSKNLVGDYSFKINELYIYTTKENIQKSLILFWRCFGGISSMYFLALSTPINEIILVMKRFHCPKVIVELMYLVYRFIFILLETESKMKIAIESRLGFINYKTSLLSFGKIISNLLIISIRKADILYDAMESRGYRGEIRFLELEKKIDKKVFIGMIISIIYLIGISLVAR